MPSPNTFSIAPISDLLDRWLSGLAIIIDPFARNSLRGTHRNDLNPDTLATSHMMAEDFAATLAGVEADAILFDPPYSPRQISECYKSVGKPVGMVETQHPKMLSACKNAFAPLIKPHGIAITFSWNTVGFGLKRGFEPIEVMLVCHGGSHNDTIVTVERRKEWTTNPSLFQTP